MSRLGEASAVNVNRNASVPCGLMPSGKLLRVFFAIFSASYSSPNSPEDWALAAGRSTVHTRDGSCRTSECC